MTRLWNDPADFAEEMIDGFVAAHATYVRRVPGGVVRREGARPGQVAVVIGGGSGHYPAFGGLVGRGLAHGAAMGNLFASPSTQQVHAVASAAHRGGGVFFSYGNYAGDVLNFDAAQERLRADGIACATVTVTDDISSAGPDERHRRRGIAGDLTVFRIAGAAAEAGYDLDGVTRIAAHANERTRSFGVAFSGCTLPGAPAPLFSVPIGRMAVGLGIHGEPGIGETDVPTADELADLLVDHLLAEVPDGVEVSGCRVVPILNGLGSLAAEELFVLYRRVAARLTEVGAVIVDPHVGDYCTSFDMAGTSLTLFWLDDELATLWDTPVDTPAYRRAPQEVDRARVGGGRPATDEALATSTRPTPAAPVTSGDDQSRRCATTVLHLLDTATTTIDRHADELGRMDAVAGDGDHGIGMQRGARAARAAAAEAVAAGAGAESVLRRAADAWSDRAGGTSGALWGLILTAIAAHLGDAGTPAPAQVAAGVADAARTVQAHGGAAVGDKTLVDALVPFSDALSRAVAAGTPLAEAWTAAASAARTAATATADLLPRRGRARTHGTASVGTPDPGAHSLALIADATAGALADSERTHA